METDAVRFYKNKTHTHMWMAHNSHPHQKYGLRNDIDDDDDDEDTMRNFDEKNENDGGRGGRKTKWEEKSNTLTHTRAHT